VGDKKLKSLGELIARLYQISAEVRDPSDNTITGGGAVSWYRDDIRWEVDL
jgi:hypothetical protein